MRRATRARLRPGPGARSLLLVLVLGAALHGVPRPPHGGSSTWGGSASEASEPDRSAPRSALATAHERRRAGLDARAEYGRAAGAPGVRASARDEALYWFGALSLRADEPGGRALLEGLVASAFEPDVRLRAASLLVTHAADAASASRALDVARRSLERRAREATADGERWRRALERLAERVAARRGDDSAAKFFSRERSGSVCNPAKSHLE